MRHLCVMNGWANAPHQWRNHLCRPPRLERYAGRVWEFSWMGFVWFFET